MALVGGTGVGAESLTCGWLCLSRMVHVSSLRAGGRPPLWRRVHLVVSLQETVNPLRGKVKTGVDMAIFHLQVRSGSRAEGGALNHGRYIRRDSRYSGKFEDKRSDHEEVVLNLPGWARSSDDAWAMIDKHERKNASSYREFEISLPIELTRDDNRRLTKEWVEREFPNHFVEIGLHWKDGNPHAHVQVCERIGIHLKASAEAAFKRPASAYRHRKTGEIVQPTPDQIANSGCKKSDRFTGNHLVQEPGEPVFDYKKRVKKIRKAALVEVRASWADAINAVLPAHVERVSHLSNEARGLDKPASAHVSRAVRGMAKRGIKSPQLAVVAELEDRRAYVISERLAADRAAKVGEVRGENQSAARSAEARYIENASQKFHDVREAPAFRTKTDTEKSVAAHPFIVRQLDMGRQMQKYFDGLPCTICPLVKVHNPGFETPAYFAPGNNLKPVAYGRTDGGIVVPEPTKITDEQIRQLLVEVAGSSGAVELFGDATWQARCSAIAGRMGLKTNYAGPAGPSPAAREPGEDWRLSAGSSDNSGREQAAQPRLT